jgi:hypothetical protein
MYTGFHRKPADAQTVKLTFLSSAFELLRKPKEVDIQKPDPSHGPNRPHISSVTSNFKERRDKTNWLRPDLLGAPGLKCLLFFAASRCLGW